MIDKLLIYVYVKSPVINWTYLPSTIERVELNVVPNQLMDCLKFLERCPYIVIGKAVNLPIWVLNAILQMPKLVSLLCDGEIQLNDEDEPKTMATHLLFFKLKIQNPQYLRLLQSKLIGNNKLETFVMKNKSPIIEEICNHNKRNNQKLRPLQQLAYSCVKSHNLEIPSYIISQLDSK